MLVQTLQEASAKTGLDGKDMCWDKHLWRIRRQRVGENLSYLDLNRFVWVLTTLYFTFGYFILFFINKKITSKFAIKIHHNQTLAYEFVFIIIMWHYNKMTIPRPFPKWQTGGFSLVGKTLPSSQCRHKMIKAAVTWI